MLGGKKDEYSKKFALLSAVCAVFCLSNFQTAFAYPDYVAVISNYKDVKTRIQIHRANGPATGSQALLYPGDKITGNVGYIRIERAPYADFHNINNEYYLISYNPPSGLTKLANNLYELTKLFWIKVDNILVKNGESSLDAKARGSKSKSANCGFDLNPRPGFNTTLLNNQKICFAGVSKTDKGRLITPKSYVIKNGNGQEIYNGIFDKNGVAELDLSSQNFQAGEKYIWVVDGTTEYDFTILDEETTRMIQNYFDEIDAKKTLSKQERLLEKAFWAQQISDNSDGKIDLYWLSAQLLTDVSQKSDDINLEKYLMLRKCHRHLEDEFKIWLRSGN